MKRTSFGIFVLIVAISLSAFTNLSDKPVTEYVWFTVTNGVMDTQNGILSTDPPSGCILPDGILCARAFDESEATPNSGSNPVTYTLNGGVDPVDDANFEKFKTN